MKIYIYILSLLVVFVSGCSTKKNNFFTRQYHSLTTNYNVYFNGNEAFESGLEKMQNNHKEDYTHLLPVFVSKVDQTRSLSNSDMDYAIEKAVKAIDKHSITAKPKRRKNKDSEKYEEFRKKREYNNRISLCYLLLGKAYFYKKKYTMANNTFRFILRQYPDNEELATEVKLWSFRSNTEMERYDDAALDMAVLEGKELKKKQKELFAAAKADFYIRQEENKKAVEATEELVRVTRNSHRKPRYNFLLSQLYLEEGKDGDAMRALKKVVNFNFNYDMVFNAKITMALAYQEGDESLKKRLKKMLNDVKNEEYKDRIYYALGSIEEKKGNMEGAVDHYWESVRSSISNDNQKSLSFLKLGDYYFKGRAYVPAQLCYDSCLYFMDTRVDNYESLKERVDNLTDLVHNLNIIQEQDSLLKLAAMPEKERNQIIDAQIQKIKDEEEKAKELERQAQEERNFYYSNNMISRGGGVTSGPSTTGGGGGEWYFYNPVTIAMGKNEFRRKWGRRKLEDNWRRMNKSVVEPVDADGELLADDMAEGQEEEEVDLKSRDYYLSHIPLSPDKAAASEEMVQEAYYSAGESYLFIFNDPEKALACFEAYMQRFTMSMKLSQVYYLAYYSAEEAGLTEKATQYRNELIIKFPNSEQAKGLLDPEFYQKQEQEAVIVNKLYEEAYALYKNIYYKEALAICNDILNKYPENKLRANVLFLRAMCMTNLNTDSEIRIALNDVLDAKPGGAINSVVSSILASMNVGEKPMVYTDAEMSNERSMKANRRWVFSDEPGTEGAEDEGFKVPYRADKSAKYRFVLVLPENIKNTQALQILGRFVYINAGDIMDGKPYKAERDNLWYKTDVVTVGVFDNYTEASKYLTRVSTDRVILKSLGNHDYRMFLITDANLEWLKRARNVDGYVDFFIKNYFEDSKMGESITGVHGTSAHLFVYEEDTDYDFVLMLPYRKVNMKRIAEMIQAIEPAYMPERENYDATYEMLTLRDIGHQEQALEQMNSIMQNSELNHRLANIDYKVFVITRANLATLKDGKYINEYMTFFTNHFLRGLKGETGIEDGEFIYNPNVNHKFVLLYSNKTDPFKLKAEFEKVNYTGLTLNNVRYDNGYDCLTISGFNDKETAMRYFNLIIKNSAVYKLLKNTDFRNFVASEYNFNILNEKQLANEYLVFFKKYYLDY